MSVGYIVLWKHLLTNPEFRRLMRRVAGDLPPTALTESLALGYLAKLWMLADSHLRDDDTLDMSADEVDQFLGVQDCAQVLGPNWLEVLDAHHVRLPNYLAHNNSSARRRALTAARVGKYRDRKRDAAQRASVTNGVTEGNGDALPDALPPIPSHPIPAQPNKNPQTPSGGLKMKLPGGGK